MRINDEPQLLQMNLEALIVDDEIDICYLLSGILRKKNLTTTYVTSISEAEKSLANHSPSVLFLDNNLPDGFGMDLISRVKKEYPFVKIIMLTAHDTSIDKQNALSRGADIFIGKPFTRDTIIKSLDVLFSKTA